MNTDGRVACCGSISEYNLTGEAKGIQPVCSTFMKISTKKITAHSITGVVVAKQLVGPADSDHCGSSLMLALELCDQLGVKVLRKKLEGPTTTLSFLGILLNTVKMEVRFARG